MPLHACLLLVTLTALPTRAAAVQAGRTYFVAGNGDDGRSGLGASNAWRTITRVNAQTLVPGDSVLFEGGLVFSGTIELRAGESGSPSQPITFASYGGEAAVIHARLGTGFDLVDVAGIHIRELLIVGSGGLRNGGIGISLYSQLPGDVKLHNIRIERCRVTGFRRGGISIGAYNGRTGFADVRVEHCRIDRNGNNGMAVWGFYDRNWGQELADYAHRDLYVGHNVFASNWGDPLRTNGHTGSGLEIAQAARVLVEFNLAFDNGRLNTYSGGGPVGIWLWDVLQGVVQFNESHHNQSASLDGGGFDLDGGSVQCFLQYNYSHDNEGPGFLVAQFPDGARPMRDVRVRYNVSERDGGRADSGALQLWSGDPAGPPLERVLFHSNTVFVEARSLGIAKAFRAFGAGSVSGSGFANNIFFTRGPGVWLGENAMSVPPLWVGNLYFAQEGPFVLSDTGSSYASLSAWRAGRGQELLLGSPVGVQADPLLSAPGTGGTLDDPTALATLDAYRLQPTSPFADLGLALPSLGITVGLRDFYGRSLPAGTGYSIGADEGP